MSESDTTILLVEDDQFSSDLYAELLKDEGFAVECARDGEKGYQMMKKGGWDLVLLDVILPKMDGFEILNKLKKEGLLKKIKHIFLLTNLTQEAGVKKKTKVKVDEYLIKSSLTPDQLITKVKAKLS